MTTTDGFQPMPLDEAFKALRAFDYTFPEAALRSVVAQWKEAAPRLLAEFRRMADHPSLLDDDENNLFTQYALYLFAGLRDIRILDPLKALLTKSGEELYDLWGEGV